MFPCMSPEGARGAIAWYIARRVFANIDAMTSRPVVPGAKYDWFADKPKYVPITTQQAIDAVCARVRSKEVT